MTYIFSLRHPNHNDYVVNEELNRENFEEVFKLCSSNGRVGFFKAILISVRTDKQHFWQDLLFPSLINHALKTNHVALKIITGLLCIIVDMATLIVRLLTLYPRYRYNLIHTRDHHPLHKFLIKHKVNPKDLAADNMVLRLVCTNNNGTNLKEIECDFNFVDTPTKREKGSESGLVQKTMLPSPSPEQMKIITGKTTHFLAFLNGKDSATIEEIE